MSHALHIKIGTFACFLITTWNTKVTARTFRFLFLANLCHESSTDHDQEQPVDIKQLRSRNLDASSKEGLYFYQTMGLLICSKVANDSHKPGAT